LPQAAVVWHRRIVTSVIDRSEALDQLRPVPSTSVEPDAISDRPQPGRASHSRRIPSLGDAQALIRHFRSPNSGLLGQLVRYGLAGGLVTLLYLTVTTVLSQVVGLPFELALAIGFACALLLHFTLQRLFVWVHSDGFALRVGHQVRRYLLMAGSQYGLTALSTAVLPRALGLPTEVIYLATMVVVTGAGFLLMRFVIFHGSDSALSPR
jgi:putative flippase GtrA